MFVFTIIPLQKKMNHVISLRQSTETGPEMKQTISRPKGTCQSREIHFNNCINDHYSENISEARNLITTIKQNSPQNKTNDLVTKGNLPKP